MLDLGIVLAFSIVLIHIVECPWKRHMKTLKPGLHVGHFARTGNMTLLSDVAGIAKP